MLRLRNIRRLGRIARFKRSIYLFKRRIQRFGRRLQR